MVKSTVPKHRSDNVCSCIKHTCKSVGQTIEYNSEKKAHIFDADDFGRYSVSSTLCSDDEVFRSLQEECHNICWKNRQSTCGDFDDLQSSCVYFCSDYCIQRKCRLSDLDIAQDGVTNVKEDMSSVDTEARQRRYCERKCRSVHMDAFWFSANAPEHFSDYALCMLKC